MIVLTCAQCQATLEVDDAFAGGVCRCQHCGTIQTVPRAGAAEVNGVPMADEPRALYQVKPRVGSSSMASGLEELAEVIHSSGLGGSGLRNKSPAHIAAATVKKNRLPLIAAVVAGVIVLIAAAAVALLLRAKPDAATAEPGAVAHGTAISGSSVSGPAGIATPNFAGVPLSGERVAFLLDRGDATADYFPSLKALTERAIRSLGPDRKFQIVLWDNGSVDSYPLSPGYCTPEEADKAAKWFDDVATGRPTEIASSLKVALDGDPDALVLVTGKSAQLIDSAPEFAADFVTQLRTAKIPVHGITLGQAPPGDPLRKIALETGGKYTVLSKADLERLVG